MSGPPFAGLFVEHHEKKLPESLRARARELARAVERERGERPLPPGTEIGRYVIESVLGSGGQATVYRARHCDMKRTVALKIPRAGVTERLLREARILAKLRHERIVSIYAVELDPVPHLAMELLPRGSLAEHLAFMREDPKERYFPLERIEAVADAVLRALEFAHASGVVHRDVKPANILFTEEGHAKVADFGIGTIALAESGEGLAHSLSLSGATAFAGTPLYMAPEQENIALAKDGRVDGRADLYALGKLLYEMLTGRSPRTVRPVSLDRAADVPLEWDAFIFRLVEDRPEDRYPSARAARDALAQLGLISIQREANLERIGYPKATSPAPDLVMAESRGFKKGLEVAAATKEVEVRRLAPEKPARWDAGRSQAKVPWWKLALLIIVSALVISFAIAFVFMPGPDVLGSALLFLFALGEAAWVVSRWRWHR